jgi:Protein of unknown function (DUF3987)
LRRLMSEEDEVDGMWPRFLWFSVPDSAMPAPGKFPAIDITDTLRSVYNDLDTLPHQTYRFSETAQQHYAAWHDWAQAQKMASASESAKAVYPKSCEQAARIALVAHLTEAAATSSYPSPEISIETLKAAISVTQYCINQALLIYGDLGVTEDNPEAIRIASLVKRFAGQSVRWKQVRPSLPKVKAGGTRRAANKSETVKFLRNIVDLGYASDISGDCSEVLIRGVA